MAQQRRPAQGALAAGVGLLLLAACAPSPAVPVPAPGPGGPPAPAAPAAPAPTTKQPQSGGLFRWANHDDTPYFDPFQSGSGARWVHMGLIYNGLMKWPNEPVFALDKVLCDLCEKWEQPDPQTYMFRLRQGVKFHNLPPANGREMTADDVVFSWERMLSGNPKFQEALFFKPIVSKVEALDRYTVKISLSSPLPAFLYQLADTKAGVMVVAREAVAEDDLLTTTAVGTGPFMLKERTPKVKSLYLKNPDYFEKGLPYLDAIEVLTIPDLVARFNALRAGQVDDAGYFLTRENTRTIETRHPELTYEAGIRGKPLAAVRFNVTASPVNDLRVRRAMFLAVDRDELIETIYLGDAIVNEWITSLVGGVAPSDEELRKKPGFRAPKDQDLAEARRLLAEAGYPGGLKLKLQVLKGEASDTAVVLREQMKKIGLDLEIEIVESAVMTKREQDGAYEVQIQRPDDAPPFARSLLQYYTGNDMKYSNQRMDELVSQAKVTSSTEEHRRIYREAVSILDRDLPLIPLITSKHYRAWPKKFQGLRVDPVSYGLGTRWMSNAWLER